MKTAGMRSVMAQVSALIIIVATVASCGRKASTGTFKWPVVNSQSDSLTQAIDSDIFHRSVTAGTERLIERLEEMGSDSRPDDTEREELENRARYMRAFVSLRKGDKQTGDSLMACALAATDSTAHPYLYNRLLHLADDNEVSIEGFERIRARLHFFEEAGDRFMTAAHYTELGNLLKDVRDPQGAVAAYSSADSLYKLAGYEEVATFNRMNLGNTLMTVCDTAGAVAIYRELLSAPSVQKRPDVLAKLYHNLYNAEPTEANLDSLLKYDTGTDHPGRVLNIRSEAAFRSGDYVAAQEWADKAVDAALEDGDGDAIAYGLYNGAYALAAQGKKSEAYDWLTEAVNLTDTIAYLNKSEEISALETARRIARYELEIQVAEGKRTLMWVCIGFGLFIVLCVAGVLVWRKVRRLQSQRREAAEERDRVSRQLMATQIVMDETEKLIDTVSREIDDKADSGRLSHGETRNIMSAIKSHTTKHGERQAFMESMATIHPDFPKRLRQINPAFTELDIRLAGFIAMGMDTKHIADTLGVRPESVKQARWRLRNKLSLAKGASLEDALRELM
ncbi:MAG: hypothetical protein NC187_05485 [Candidatus Amulumruptor caecigallinarius]|nr:hypothetical protein [Candidatus Amulumruptor caecigallinarius]MCM1396921.1 hypothetical protein [Candidatus Amulumruptor caecigallinarius]MCM1454135.1 hypothetical protein [bacterium]